MSTAMLWCGLYNNSQTYNAGDVVSVSGSSYVAIQNGFSGVAPDIIPPNNTYWSVSAFRGASGPTGPTGLGGPTGPTGPIGLTGATGPVGLLSAATTLYISSTGSDSTGTGTVGNPWLTVGKAVASLAAFVLNSPVTIQCADGHYNSLSNIVISHPQGYLITVTGGTLPTTSLTSVASSSGSAGAWSYVLNVGSTASIVVGDYILLRATTGGSNPMYLRGVHQVTAVGAGQITVTVASNSATLASGAVTDTISVLKTVFNFTSGQDGISAALGCSLGGLSNLAVVGGGAKTHSGLSVTIGSSSISCNNIGVSNWDFGVNASIGTIAFGSSCVSSCGTYGAVAQAGGKLFVAANGVASGCTLGFASIQGSTASANSTTSVGNAAVGYYSVNNATMVSFSSNAYGNASGGYYSDVNGHISADASTASGNGNGVYANAVSFVNFVGGTCTGNTTNFSPAVNTLGNENSYINT